MSKKQNKSKLNGGFTLIEVLIAVSLVAYALIAILGTLVAQGKKNNAVNEMNIAIILAEEKIEEYFKFPIADMPAGATDYIVYSLNRTPVYPTSRSNAVSIGNPFQRTVTITDEGDQALIEVRVDYGYDRDRDKFNFSVNLSTRKGG